MRQKISRAMRVSVVMSVILAGAIALQVSCTHGGRMLGGCSITPGPRSVTIGVVNNVLTLSQDDVQACPGDQVSWTKTDPSDTNTYTVKFNNANADACNWAASSKSVPASCTIPSGASPTSGSGDKYTATCTSSNCAAVPPLDPHIIIM